MSDIISSWIAESRDNEREFNRQALIIDVAEAISQKMEERCINKSTLAKLLEKTTSFVTQVLTGSRNMTLSTLADLAFALDAKVRISVIDCDKYDDWNYEDYQLSPLIFQAQDLEQVSPCNDELYHARIVPFRSRKAA